MRAGRGFLPAVLRLVCCVRLIVRMWTVGVDEIKIDPKSGMPVWVQLRNRLLYLIASGYYPVGSQLPTLHGLATQLSINYNTVNKVYQSLMRDGLVESRRGCGTIVISSTMEGRTSPATTAELLTEEYLEKLAELGLTPEDALVLVRDKTGRSA